MKTLLARMRGRIGRRPRDERGMLLVIIMGFMALMAVTTIMFTSFIKSDIDLLGRAKLVAQAQNIAEAGINHALSKLREDGFDIQNEFYGTLDTGSYRVTFRQEGDRVLVTSVGTVPAGVSRTAAVEVKNTTPTSLFYAISSGGTLAMSTFWGGNVAVTGDIHSNYLVDLRTVGGSINVTGHVSSCGVVQEGNRYDRDDFYDNGVTINGIADDQAEVLEYQPRVSFPVFYYAKYMQEAKDGGSYYNRSTTFYSQTLTPTKGIVYVKGRATFYGDCYIYGGIVATEIVINGRLYQRKTGDRNMIVASTGGISIGTLLSVEEALVYAKLDIRNKYYNSSVNLTGVMIAGRNVSLSSLTSGMTYTYKLTCPSDMLSEVGDPSENLEVVSWNK